MKIIHITLVFSLCLALASCYLLPKRRSRTIKPDGEIKFPAGFQAGGHKMMPGLRIPNEEFCKTMQLQAYRHYLVLPWWYNYCAKLYEKDEKMFQKNSMLLPFYNQMLRMVNEYKKRKGL